MVSGEWTEDLAGVRTGPLHIHSVSWLPSGSYPVPVAKHVHSTEGWPVSSYVPAGPRRDGTSILQLQPPECG